MSKKLINKVGEIHFLDVEPKEWGSGVLLEYFFNRCSQFLFAQAQAIWLQKQINHTLMTGMPWLYDSDYKMYLWRHNMTESDGWRFAGWLEKH